MSQPTASEARVILQAEEINQKIRRIAYEIYERNFQQQGLIIAGIEDRGYSLASRIADTLDEISHFRYAEQRLQLVRVALEKFTSRQCSVSLSCALDTLDGKSIILVDDVLNTGRTLAYSMRPFLERNISRMEIAVLVNRSHSKFPVVASYTGYELATTLEEHIEVVLDGKEDAVYLK
jgi:pyrimidine operon attenuation protein/uracil phosphoribosyltransferase